MNERERLRLIEVCEEISERYDINPSDLFNYVCEKYINKDKSWTNITVEHIAQKLIKKRK
jgi:hypothetical protein